MALGTIGKYERLDVLGHGASGIVYLARDTLLRRQVAIKEVSAQGDERERFLEEARVLDRLRHPNIVAVNNVDTINGKIVIDMEFVDGENLLEMLRERDGPLPVDLAVDIAIQVCDGLDYAQAHHIVHRDVKPANVLVARSGQVKLVDFGLAEVLGTNSFVGGAGTYAYMAPEDFDEDDSSDAQSDIWAVGVILYEILTGRRPFSVARPKDPFAWKRAIETQPITPPDLIRPEVTEALSEVCLTALARDRAQRYRTAGDLAAALRRARRGEPARLHSSVDRAASGEPSYHPAGLIGATDIDTFLSAAPDNWERARRALTSGELAAWLSAIGEEPLAEIAEEAAKLSRLDDSDHDALLRDFLYRAGLDTPALARRAANAGSSLLRAGACEDAAEALTQAVRLDPVHASYFVQLQRALAGSGDAAGAAAALSRGLELHPRDRALRRERESRDYARPEISPRSIDFGVLRQGEQVKTKITVSNPSASSGVLQGRITSAPAWIEVSPESFVTRRRQPIVVVANTSELWDRDREYEGRIVIETSSGPLEVSVAVEARAPMRSFNESFLWYAPLMLLALAPLLAGELATLRHTHDHVAEPFYAVGMLASGLFFASVWKTGADADVGPAERLFAGLGALLAPIGVWLCAANWSDHAGALWQPLLAVLPAAVLLIIQGIARLNSPEQWGRWPIWGWIGGIVAALVTGVFWEMTK